MEVLVFTSLYENNGTQTEQRALMMLYTLQILIPRREKLPLLFHYVVFLSKTLHDSHSAYVHPVV